VNDKKPKVEVLPIEQGATPDPNNANKHTQRGRGMHENSMRKRGAGRSIFSAGKGVTVPVTMGGNQTLEIAETLGMEIINVHTTGQQVVNVVRDDIEPGSAEFYAMAIEDNEIGKQSYNPDIDVIAALTVGENALLSALRKQDDIFDGLLGGMGNFYAPPSLDDLKNEYGEPTERDFWPIIRVQVSPETETKYKALMATLPGADEAEKFDVLISRAELS
jgi:hypothetical protein